MDSPPPLPPPPPPPPENDLIRDGGVLFTPECSLELKKGEIEHRGHATYYPKRKRLVVTEQGRCYDDHGAVYFHCDTIEDAEMILEHIIEVTTH